MFSAAPSFPKSLLLALWNLGANPNSKGELCIYLGRKNVDMVTIHGNPVPFVVKREKEATEAKYNEQQIKVFTFWLGAVASPIFCAQGLLFSLKTRSTKGLGVKDTQAPSWAPLLDCSQKKQWLSHCVIQGYLKLCVKFTQPRLQLGPVCNSHFRKHCVISLAPYSSME